jgi:3-dehydroquinate dehydratase-2
LLSEINQMLRESAQQAGHTIEILQSNHEGELVDSIQRHGPQADILIINPAAYTHTSVALRDAILAVHIPAIEVHLSNVHRREVFRRHSYVADIAVGQVAGFGPSSYLLALQAACQVLRQPPAAASAGHEEQPEGRENGDRSVPLRPVDRKIPKA